MINHANKIRELTEKFLKTSKSNLLFCEGIDDTFYGTLPKILKEFDSQCFELPCSENASIGMVLGAASYGVNPIICFQRVEFALLAFEQAGIKPSKYLNQNIENITKNLEAGKISGAAIWEPTASKIEMLGIARRAATGADFEGDDAGDAGFLVMMNEIIQTRPDVHRGWLEAELDAQLFLADTDNANEVAKMADDQTEGMDRKILWASLYRDENRVNKLTLDFVFNDKVRNMLNASAAFLAGKKKFGKRTTLRPQAVYDEVARQVLADRGLKSPLGKIDGVPLSEYRP